MRRRGKGRRGCTCVIFDLLSRKTARERSEAIDVWSLNVCDFGGTLARVVQVATPEKVEICDGAAREGQPPNLRIRSERTSSHMIPFQALSTSVCSFSQPAVVPLSSPSRPRSSS